MLCSSSSGTLSSELLSSTLCDYFENISIKYSCSKGCKFEVITVRLREERILSDFSPQICCWAWRIISSETIRSEDILARVEVHNSFIIENIDSRREQVPGARRQRNAMQAITKYVVIFLPALFYTKV